MTSEDAARIAGMTLMLFMLTPIACTGDISSLFTTDASANFQKVASSLPISLPKRVACRYLVSLILIGVGVVVDLFLSYVLSAVTGLISFVEFSGIIVTAASIIMMYISMVIVLIMIMGEKQLIYAVVIPCVTGVLLFVLIYWDYFKEALLNPEVNMIGELYDKILHFIEYKSYIVLAIGCVSMVISYVITLGMARRKRGVF